MVSVKSYTEYNFNKWLERGTSLFADSNEDLQFYQTLEIDEDTGEVVSKSVSSGLSNINTNKLSKVEAEELIGNLNILTPNDVDKLIADQFDAIVDVNSTSDYVDIQSAIDDGHTTIYVKDGTYSITSAIEPTTNCVIIGESREGTIINVGTNNINAFEITGSDFYNTGTISISNDSATVTGTGTSFTSAMEGMEILIDGKLYEISSVGGTTSLTISSNYQGKDVSGASYWIADHKTVRIENLTITSGLLTTLKSAIAGTYLVNCVFRNLKIYGNTTYFGSIYSNYVVDNLISFNQIGPANCGILLSNSYGNIIVNNHISKMPTTDTNYPLNDNIGGITLGSNCSHNQVIGNNTSYNGNAGISMYGGSGSQYNLVSNNIANNNSGTGIAVYDSPNNQIINNQCKYNLYEGIEVEGSDQSVVNNNYLYDNIDTDDVGGIHLDDSQECQVVGNWVYLSNIGINIDASNRCIVNSNYIYDSDADGVKLVNGSDNNIVATNYIYQAGGYGVNIAGATEDETLVHGNYFLACSSGGLDDNGTSTTSSDNVTT